MTKLVILALAFTAIVAFAEVSSYTTTTITTIMEDVPTRSRSQSQGQCRRRIQGQQVNHCQMHIIEGSSFQDDLIRMPVENLRQQQQPHLQLCCQQLRNVEQECQCEAISQAFEEAQRQQQGGRRGGQEQQGGRRWEQEQQGGRRGWQGQQGGRQSTQQMLRRAEQIPNQCNLQVQQCRVQSRWF